MQKAKKTRFAALAALSGGLLAACGGIGDGNGPASMEILIGGESADAELFECLIATPQLLVTFDNGRIGDFSNRATWRSSDESILQVSDGTLETNGFILRRGSLLPIKDGTVTLTAEYLNFSYDIAVTVFDSEIELSPQQQTIAQGNRLLLQASGIFKGRNFTTVGSLSGFGQWSVAAADGTSEAVGEIDAASGVYSAKENVAGTDTATFELEFCNRTASVNLEVVNQQLQSLRVDRADGSENDLTSLNLASDTSVELEVRGIYDGGLEQQFTGLVSYAFDTSNVAYNNVRGLGVITSFAETQGQSTNMTVSYDPDSEVEGDEITSSPVAISVLDVTLDPDSFVITPADATLLPSTSVNFAVSADFTGNDGPVTFDLTRDILWSSSDTSIAVVSNVPGNDGFAVGGNESFGTVTVGVTRLSSDAPATAPTTTLTIGSADGTDNVELTALNLVPQNASLNFGDSLQLSAIGDLSNTTLNTTQDLSQIVIWSVSDASQAQITNLSARRGVLRALTQDADVQITVQARYFDTRVQAAEVIGQMVVTLNPTP